MLKKSWAASVSQADPAEEIGNVNSFFRAPSNKQLIHPLENFKRLLLPFHLRPRLFLHEVVDRASRLRSSRSVPPFRPFLRLLSPQRISHKICFEMTTCGEPPITVES